MLEAIFFGHDVIQRICDAIEELRAKTGWKPRRRSPTKPVNPAAIAAVATGFADALKTALHKRDEARAPGRGREGRRQGDQGRARRRREQGARPRASSRRPTSRRAIHEVERDPDPRGGAGRQARRRPRRERHPPDHDRGGRPPPRARLGALHARRDAGARGRDARHGRRREDRRRAQHRSRRARSTTCTTTSRRCRSARPAPSAGPRAARSATGPWPSARSLPVLPDAVHVPVHAAHRLRHPDVERLVVDGDGVRRDAGA